jgi:hypothetical protein
MMYYYLPEEGIAVELPGMFCRLSAEVWPQGIYSQELWPGFV